MRRLDAFLTRMAQKHWPDALVFCDAENEPGEVWTLERPGGSVALGAKFKIARSALEMMLSAHAQASKNPAGVALGSIKSEKKAVSSAKNGKLGGRPKLK